MEPLKDNFGGVTDFRVTLAEEGLNTKASNLVCGASYSVAGVHFHCANNKRHGVQNLAQALQNSCNQSFIQIAARLGKDAFCQIRRGYDFLIQRRNHRLPDRIETEAIVCC